MAISATFVIIRSIPFLSIYYYFESKSEKSIQKCLDSFYETERPGTDFVRLIRRGSIRTLKTGNHGNDFPDIKNLETFERYSNEDIRVALNNIEAEAL